MNTYYECLPCFVNQALGALRRTRASQKQVQETMRAVFGELAAIDFTLTPPSTATRIYRLVRHCVGSHDPFAEDKQRFNDFAGKLLDELRASADTADDPFLARVRLAIGANIIDFGKNDALCEREVRGCMERAASAPIDESAAARLRREITNAGAILYLCDNSGEIVFDRFLIEALPHHKITCAVRGAPIINDATMGDAREVTLTDLVPVISNGSDAPGTVLADCCKGFQQVFTDADLVIAKGQGNFETLSEVEGKHIFFLMQIKCPVIARDSGYPVGSFVIKEVGG